MNNFNLELEIEKAKKYIVGGNVDSAIKILENLKKYDKNNFTVLFELGKAYLISNKNIDAINNLNSAKEIKNNDINLNLLLAKSFKNNKQYVKSIKILFDLKRKGFKEENIDKDILMLLMVKKKYVYAKKYIDKYLTRKEYCVYFNELINNKVYFNKFCNYMLLNVEYFYFEILKEKMCFKEIDVLKKLLCLYIQSKSNIFKKKECFIKFVYNKIDTSSNPLKKAYKKILNIIEMHNRKLLLLSKPIK
jgi:hypothetical protein